MVIAPASTGKERRSRTAVIKIDQTKSGIVENLIEGFILIEVVIKLIAPKIDEIPARCKEKIEISTAFPEWNILFERGGYTVHPVPAPLSISIPDRRNRIEGGSNQNLRLFIRGNAISGAPIINGRSQFPNPPIIVGITIKKIIMKAWIVTMEL